MTNDDETLMLDNTSIASNGVGTGQETLLREALEANGQRLTDQRAAVYRFLAGTDTHPTADDVFTSVRSDIPDISLATVYKSLETLVGCGLAQKLTYGDGSARYDGRTDPHHHARCLRCGHHLEIPDLDEEKIYRPLLKKSGFHVLGHEMHFYGICKDCQDKENQTV